MELEQYMPMSETGYYILIALWQERHGYGIMQFVEEMTDKRIVLGPGTLYGTLVKFEKAGLIWLSREEDKRKYYTITDRGRALAQAELARLQELCTKGKETMENAN